MKLVFTDGPIGIQKLLNIDPNLTYPQAIAAYDGMIAIDLIRVTRSGFYDRDTGRRMLLRS